MSMNKRRPVLRRRGNYKGMGKVRVKMMRKTRVKKTRELEEVGESIVRVRVRAKERLELRENSEVQ